ncbi:MAG: hypothetical protein QGI83_18220, partial [Candidatus Latescibacteria bacterium]|nr:hypothetical protein [Candidatus Latescibacterota bacterium]
MWTPDGIHSEIERLKPALKALGLKTPLRRARALLDLEEDWEDEGTQSRWESRIAFWRGVLLGEGEGFALPELIDLHPSDPASDASQIPEDGDRAEATWADYLRARSGVREYLEDKTLRDEVIGTQSWGIYREDGSHDPQRAEDLVASRPRIHNFDPPEM